MPRSFTFTTISDYLAAKATSGTGNVIYAELVSSGIKSGSVVSKITATGDVFIDSINPFVTPDLGQEGDTLYYSATEGYRFLRAGNSAWDATSYGQVFIDLTKIPAGFSVVAPFTDVFTFKKTTEDIGSGRSSMSKIKGNSVAWNQILPNSLTHQTGTTTENKVNVGLSTSTGANFSIISGHKYAFVTTTSITSDAVNLRDTINGVTINFSVTNGSGIVTSNATANKVYIQFGGFTTGQAYDFYCFVVDLTLHYGTSIDGMTDKQILAKFESEFPLGYYAHNPGQLLSNKAKAIEFVGFNQWDEEWESGTYNQSGDKIPREGAIRSTNYIPCFGNVAYYYNAGNITGGRVCFYDVNKSFISEVTGSANSIITTPANARFLTFAIGYATYQNNICINLSGPRNGQYEPYKKNTLQVPITALRGKLNGQGNSVNIFPEGLKSAGSVCDEIGHGYAIKRVGTVDLGTPDWNYATSGTYPYFQTSANDIGIAKCSPENVANIICSKYAARPAALAAGGTNGIAAFNSAANKFVRVFESSYTDASTFKAAMSGVMLNYKLAEPEYYVLDRDFNWKYRVSEYHTKKALPENGEEPTTAPFACEIKQI